VRDTHAAAPVASATSAAAGGTCDEAGEWWRGGLRGSNGRAHSPLPPPAATAAPSTARLSGCASRGSSRCRSQQPDHASRGPPPTIGTTAAPTPSGADHATITGHLGTIANSRPAARGTAAPLRGPTSATVAASAAAAATKKWGERSTGRCRGGRRLRSDSAYASCRAQPTARSGAHPLRSKGERGLLCIWPCGRGDACVAAAPVHLPTDLLKSRANGPARAEVGSWVLCLTFGMWPRARGEEVLDLSG